MAAISASHAHSTTTTLTPPASSQESNLWDYRDGYPADDALPVHQKQNGDIPYATHSEHRGTDHATHMSGDMSTRKMIVNGNKNPSKGVKRNAPHSYDSDDEQNRMSGNEDVGVFEDPHSSIRTGPERRRAPTSASTPGNPDMDDDERSKWIHRDKLARIESEELQAAGFMIPRQRTHSRVRRGDTRHHHDHGGSTAKPATDGPAPADQPAPRSRMNSSATADPKFQADSEPAVWDLRLPEEIAAEANLGFASPSGLGKGATRIPVAKLSPAPIPIDYLERESLTARKAASDGQGRETETIAYPKPRARSASMKVLEPTAPTPAPAKRSVTDTSTSPKKGATGTGARKPTARGPSGTRPKTRGSGSNKDSTSSNGGTRPSTRSGELKQPEGEPPWMLSAYRPDPRLPPDQQLLPTVARRLQQEKWEKEGKFGNVYDKEFRPLRDDGFPTPPDKEKKEVEDPGSGEPEAEQAPVDVWPLKPEAPRSQTPKPSLSSYSTMPKIQDKPPVSPLPSPRTPGMQQQHQRLSVHAPQNAPPAREEEKQAKEGCGCCIVM